MAGFAGVAGTGARRNGTWDEVVFSRGCARRSFRFNRLRLCVSQSGMGGECNVKPGQCEKQQERKQSAGTSVRVRLGEAVCKGGRGWGCNVKLARHVC